jgi:hypothetical protein
MRAVLVPVYIILMYAFETKIPALIVYIVASFTDFLDGHIARKYNLISDFGKFMDPLADKLLVTAALVIFTEQGMMPAWATMIIIAREFAVYYDLFNKYKSDYQVESILAGKASDSILERARNASFDERISLLGLIFDAIGTEVREISNIEKMMTVLMNGIKKLKVIVYARNVAIIVHR